VDESPVEQAKKYVEKRKGWRPQRRTVEYLVAMAAVLVAAALVIPRVLPGKIMDDESLIGQNRGISILNLAEGTSKKLIPAPGKDEGYSAWGMSSGREEVVATWYHKTAGKVDKVSVRSMSGFSGRTQAEWALKGENTEPSQTGFLPTHNVIWVLVSGRIKLVDIKSAQIFDLPLEATDESGSKKKTTGMSYMSFSPKGEKLACLLGDTLVVLTGFTKEPGRGVLRMRVVLRPGATTDSAGKIITGSVGCFAWVDERTLVAVLDSPIAPNVPSVSSAYSVQSSVYSLQLANAGTPRIELRVPAEGAAVFTGISGSPSGAGFAVLESAGGAAAISRYSTVGKLTKSVKLSSGDWRPPLVWASY
jgi:hypothetical protein